MSIFPAFLISFIFVGLCAALVLPQETPSSKETQGCMLVALVFPFVFLMVVDFIIGGTAGLLIASVALVIALGIMLYLFRETPRSKKISFFILLAFLFPLVFIGGVALVIWGQYSLLVLSDEFDMQNWEEYIDPPSLPWDKDISQQDASAARTWGLLMTIFAPVLLLPRLRSQPESGNSGGWIFLYIIGSAIFWLFIGVAVP